ncbi:MAG: hypothetical protein H8E16_11230 [Flavobacteriales bacterium]|nr:hypothetical protein [Flavobacteriales bacterium]
MIRTGVTKIKNNSKSVNKYLNNIHVMNDELLDIEINVLEELLNDIDSWRICLDELELKIKSHPQYYADKKPYEYDDENKELLIY